MANATSSASERAFLPEHVDEIVAGVDGWLGPDEGRLLFRLAAEADPAGCIVEIGSWHGKSTIWLAAGARAGRGAHMVAIDPHVDAGLRQPGESTEHILRGNLERAGLAETTEIVAATSEAAAATWTRPVSLLWIDGAHDYHSVRRDLELWDPHLLSDATLALHDTFVTEGPERVVQELLIASGRYTSFVHAETTTAARRCGPLGRRAASQRSLGLVRRALYGVRLRAYDGNTLGYARLRDWFVGSTSG